MPKFLRRTWSKYSKLGKRKNKKQVWRRPTGRHNKMREKRRGYPVSVNIGYKKERSLRGNIHNSSPILIKKIEDLKKMTKGETGILGKVGKRKKFEMVRIAKEMNIKFFNFNSEKFLKENKKNIENNKKWI